MMNRKPETSLQEDLAILGLLSGDAKKALSEESEDAGSGDEDDKTGEEKAEKDEKSDDDKDDKKEDKKPNPFAPKADAAPKKEMPAFLQAKEAAEMTANLAEQLDAAWDVVHNYYKLGEAEDAELATEDLRTVIDAFAFIVESWENDGGLPKKKVNDIPGGNKEDLFPAGENPITQKATANSPTAPEWKKDEYGERGRSKSDTKYAGRHQSAQTQAESVNALVSELHDIKKAVQESGPSAEQLELSESLIAGFEAVRDTAGEVAGRIKAELAESKDVAAGDARLEATTYFEGICNDATEILSAIAEGQVEIADAAEDLSTISADLKNGLARLKDVK